MEPSIIKSFYNENLEGQRRHSVCSQKHFKRLSEPRIDCFQKDIFNRLNPSEVFFEKKLLNNENHRIENLVQSMIKEEKGSFFNLSRAKSRKNSPLVNSKIKRLRSIKSEKVSSEIVKPVNLIRNNDNYSKKFIVDLKNSSHLDLVSNLNDEVEKKVEKENILKHNQTHPFKKYNTEENLEKKRRIREIEKINDSFEDLYDDQVHVYIPIYDLYIYPESSFKLKWDLIIMCLTLYTAVVSPLNVAFSEFSNEIMIKINILLDFLYIFDIILQFFVPYINHEDELEKNYKFIALNYFRGAFFIDTISSIPDSTISYIINCLSETAEKKAINNFSLFRIFRIYKILKLARIFKFLKIFDPSRIITNKNHFFSNFDLPNGLKRILMFFLSFLISTHILACLWIYLTNYNSINWITYFNFQNLDNFSLYLASLYFIFASIFTIGYGDIYPTNNSERILNSLIMIIGVGVFSYGVSSLASFITSHDKITEKYLKNLHILDELKIQFPKLAKEQPLKIKRKSMFKPIKKQNKQVFNEFVSVEILKTDTIFEKINRFLKYNYYSNKFDKINFINELQMKIKNDLIYHMYYKLFESFKFFKFSSGEKRNDSFNSKIILSMQPIRLSRDEYLLTEGEIVEELFIVNKGVLNMELGENYNYLMIHELKKTEHFGDIFALESKRSELGIRVKSKSSEIFLVKRKDLVDISVEFPEIFSKIIRFSTLIYESIQSKIRKKIQKFNLEKDLIKSIVKKSDISLFKFSGEKVRLDEIDIVNSAQENKKIREDSNIKKHFDESKIKSLIEKINLNSKKNKTKSNILNRNSKIETNFSNTIKEKSIIINNKTKLTENINDQININNESRNVNLINFNVFINSNEKKVRSGKKCLTYKSESVNFKPQDFAQKQKKELSYTHNVHHDYFSKLGEDDIPNLPRWRGIKKNTFSLKSISEFAFSHKSDNFRRSNQSNKSIFHNNLTQRLYDSIDVEKNPERYIFNKFGKVFNNIIFEEQKEVKNLIGKLDEIYLSLNKMQNKGCRKEKKSDFKNE